MKVKFLHLWPAIAACLFSSSTPLAAAHALSMSLDPDRSSLHMIENSSDPARLSVRGLLIKGGIECPLLRADNGRVYSLTGDLGGFGAGDRVQLEGRLAEVSICMQGATVEVDGITEAE